MSNLFQGFMPPGSICLSQRSDLGAMSTKGEEAKSFRLSLLYEEAPKKKKCSQCCHGVTDGVFNRPLYQDDIFYPGSVWQLPVYQRSKASALTASKPGTSKAASYYEVTSLQ